MERLMMPEYLPDETIIAVLLMLALCSVAYAIGKLIRYIAYNRAGSRRVRRAWAAHVKTLNDHE